MYSRCILLYGHLEKLNFFAQCVNTSNLVSRCKKTITQFRKLFKNNILNKNDCCVLINITCNFMDSTIHLKYGRTSFSNKMATCINLNSRREQREQEREYSRSSVNPKQKKLGRCPYPDISQSNHRNKYISLQPEVDYLPINSRKIDSCLTCEREQELTDWKMFNHIWSPIFKGVQNVDSLSSSLCSTGDHTRRKLQWLLHMLIYLLSPTR